MGALGFTYDFFFIFWKMMATLFKKVKKKEFRNVYLNCDSMSTSFATKFRVTKKKCKI